MAEPQYHDAANIFPLDDEHIDELAADIKSHGLKVKIQTLDGKILDGRRRWMACKIAGVKPVMEAMEVDDPVAHVLSLNLQRRHLSVTQTSMVGARAREFYDREAKGRQKRKPADSVVENLPEQKGTARDKAGKAVGVSGKSIDYGTKVLRQGTPALIAAVDADKVSVSTAAKVASQPEEVQNKFAAGAKGDRKNTRTIAHVQPDIPEGEIQGQGVILANEAINCLKRIPQNDPTRKRGFQIVSAPGPRRAGGH